MRGDPRAGTAARGRAGSAARARRARRAAGGSARSASRCRPRAGRCASPSKIDIGSAGSSPGNTAASTTPSNVWPPIVSPFSGTPMIASSVSPPCRISASRVARIAASAMTSISAPTPSARAIALAVSARRIASSRSWLVWCRWSALVAANRMRVDARAEDRGEARGPAGAKGAQHVGERVLEVAQRRRPGIQRRQRVDQHDLPVEPGEMIAEERAHHMRLVGLVAPLHHRRDRARGDRVAFAERNRREGQRRRALEIARHQEPAGRQGRQRIDVVARLAQIGGEAFGDVARRILVGLGVRVEARERGAPVGRQRRAGRRLARAQRLPRPFGVGLVEQRQVEQPLARVVDEVDR